MLRSAIMAVTSIPPRALAVPPSKRLADLAPRILNDVVGDLLELVVHAVEDWRDRRDRFAR